MYRSTQTATGRWNDRYHQKWDLPQVSGRLSTDRHHESMSLRLWIGRWVCRCTYHEKKRYLKKLSGPILDRFDMVLCLSKKRLIHRRYKKRVKKHPIRSKNASKQPSKEKKLLKNYQCSDTSHLSHIQLNKLLHLSKECKEILDIAYRSGKITRRGMDKILKVALTIMLMENESEIKPIHLMEAMTFRNTGFIKEVLEYGR